MDLGTIIAIVVILVFAGFIAYKVKKSKDNKTLGSTGTKPNIDVGLDKKTHLK